MNNITPDRAAGKSPEGKGDGKSAEGKGDADKEPSPGGKSAEGKGDAYKESPLCRIVAETSAESGGSNEDESSSDDSSYSSGDSTSDVTYVEGASQDDCSFSFAEDGDENQSHLLKPRERPYCPGFSSEITEPAVYNDASEYQKKLTAAHEACYTRILSCFAECKQENRVSRPAKRDVFEVILDRKYRHQTTASKALANPLSRAFIRPHNSTKGGKHERI